MAITDRDRERIREEETTRWLVRQELRRRKRPQLVVIAAAWTLVLAILAVVLTHYGR
jgi:hypothetical protein